MRKIILLVFLGLFSLYAFSQSVDTVHIKSIVVKAGHIYSDTVIYIKNLTSFQSDLPSFTLKDYGPGQLNLLSMRGMPPRHTKVSVGGVNIVPASSGVVDFSVFPYQLFEKVRVGYFLNSELASGALGGYLNFDPEVISTPVLFNFSLGSFGTYQELNQVAIKTGEVDAGIRSFSLVSKNDFVYRNDFLPGKPLVHMKSSDFQHNASLVYVKLRGKKRFKFNFWTVGNEMFRHFPPPMSYNGAQRSEYQSIRQFFGGGRLYKVFSNSLRLEGVMGFNFEMSDYGLSLDKSLVIRSLSVNNDFQTKAKLRYNNFALGLKLDNQNYRLNTFNNEASNFMVQRFINQIYTSYIYDKNFYLQTFSGLMSIGREIFSLYSVSFGSEHLLFNFNKNINIPTLNDLYWFPGGNPNLKPEKAYESSMDFKLTLNKFYLKCSVFGKIVKNWILWKPSDYHYWTANNIGKVYARGGEFYISKQIKFSNKRNLKAGLAIAYHKVSDSLGRQLIYIPKYRILGDVQVETKYLKLCLKPVYEGKRYTIPGNEQYTLKGFFTADLFLASKNFSFKTIMFNFVLTVKNLTNSQYYLVINRPLPGINYSFLVKIWLK